MSDEAMEKIRKMLRKAEDPACTVDEAEAFTEMATKLLAKYGIEMTLAEIDITDPEQRAKVEHRTWNVTGPYSYDRALMFGAVLRAYRCQPLYLRTRQGARMDVFGFPSDINRAELLCASLDIQATRELSVARVSQDSVAAFKRTWYQGYSYKINSRLNAMEKFEVQEAKREGHPSVELVMIDRDQEIKDLLSEMYPSTQTIRRKLSGNGLRDGWAAGDRANLGTPVGSASSKETLGA